jgi:hypothetical protein
MDFEHNGQIFKFVNATEEMILDKVRIAIKNDNEMCKCEKCYYDVCCLVLNGMGAPKYVTSHQGALMSKISSSMSVQAMGVISVEILKALNMVKVKPNH